MTTSGEDTSTTSSKKHLNLLDKMKQGGGAVVGGIKTTTHKIAEGGKTAATKVADTGMSVGKAVVAPISNSTSLRSKPHEKSAAVVVVDEEATPSDEEGTDETGFETKKDTKASVPTSLMSVKSTATTKSDATDSSTLSHMMDTVKQGGETVALGIKDTSHKIAESSKNAAKKMTDTMEKALNVSKTRAIIVIEEEEEVADGDLPPVPPDETLQKMDIIISKRLKGLTIAQFHDTVWAEDPAKPLYKNWLDSSGKNEVKISDWQTGDGDEGATASKTGPWDGESYDKHRTVTFRFTRTTHLYTGPPVAEVKHTQFCRLESNEKCVLGMQIEMQGIPFADCFNVQIRWVVTRMGTERDLKIQVGLFVNFVQQTVLAGKIRSGTSEETTKTQMSLFRAIKEACAEVAGGALEEEDEDEDTAELVSCFQFNDLLLQWFGTHHWLLQWFGVHPNDDVSKKVQSAETKLKLIQEIWDASMERDDSKHVIASELTDIHASLEKILKELGTTK
mmetsp:Transcript_30447/g.50247  ORF Transcript_30447/g.50247 Transcript_30447/m.50247 type:complete len:506 (+) Transcript_30447:95-1612(+)